MLPPLRHRLIVAVATVASILAWLCLAGPLTPTDGDTGFTLASARTIPLALLLTLLVAVATSLFAAITSAAGNPLSGLFAFSFGLVVLTATGGSIDGWLRRLETTNEYFSLAAESLYWAAIVVVAMLLIDRLRSPFSSFLPPWLKPTSDNHPAGQDMGAPSGGASGGGGSGGGSGDISGGGDFKLLAWDIQSLLACLACATASALLAHLGLRSSSSGQVIGSLILAFCLGSVVAQSVFPTAKLWGILLSPFVVAAVSYLYVVYTFPKPNDLIEAWHRQTLLPTALALPLHYASAALLGTTLGTGIAQRFAASMPAQAIAHHQSEPS